jgi:hypothetical protein
VRRVAVALRPIFCKVALRRSFRPQARAIVHSLQERQPALARRPSPRALAVKA